jgi:phenylalanyl-tRNA synthetase beta chain
MVSEQLVGQGFYETMAMSLTQSQYIKAHYPLPEETLVYINNTSNAQLDLMRPAMIFSALEIVTHNQNRQRQDLRLFEFGKVYRLNAEGKPEEAWRLTLTMTGRRTAENWMNQDNGHVNLYDLKAQVELILTRLGLSGYQVSAAEDPLFRYGLKIHRGPQVFAELGLVSSRLCKALDVRNEVYFAELHWDTIVGQSAKSKLQYQDPGKYPSVRRDLAVVSATTVQYESIVALARKYGKQLLKEVNLFDVFEDESKLGAGKRSYGISLVFEDSARTLQDKEIDAIIGQLIDGCTRQLGAEIRR